MPQIYHPQPRPQRERSTSSASSTSISSDSTASIGRTDAEALSDLVRTGEASRLRRRGAIRIDHGALTSTSTHPYAGVRPPSPTIPIMDRPSWDSDFDPDSQTVLEGHLYRTPLSRFSRIRTRSSRRHGPHDPAAYIHLQDKPAEYTYTLVCGSKITKFDWDEHVEPFKPSILPLYPPLASSSSKKLTDRSTGCGTIVHTEAAPPPRVGMWAARSAASDTVIPLDASYFDAQEAAKFTRSACGCVKEGVGCAVCGNPLGIRYTPCKAASESFFLQSNNGKQNSADAPTPRLRGPEGPQYWHASSSKSTNHAIHTFFPSAVTSTPQYNFSPPTPARRQRTYSDVSAATQTPSVHEDDTYTEAEEPNGAPEWNQWGEDYTRDTGLDETGENAMILDRFSASSPIPFSETGDENISATNPAVVHDAWDIPAGYLRPPSRSAVTPTSAYYGLRSLSDGHTQPRASGSFYQQGAREQEEEMDRARNVDNDGRSVSAWGVDDLDGESEVWGAVDPGRSWSLDGYDSESADKSTEGFLFPGR